MSFHVPELARDIDHPQLGTTFMDGNNGAFHIDSPENGWKLALICSDGDSWEHVSVHAYRRSLAVSSPAQMRTPNWREMCFVKNLCWDDEDEVVQYHPKKSEYVNCHPHVLHLWRPIGVVFPMPPSVMVGPRA